MNILRPALGLVIWLLFCLAPVRADAPKAAVSFSPAVVDFGTVPSDAPCSQLVTVTFDRSVFSPEHLPVLRPKRSAYAVDVTLFARFVEPDTIRVVYRVTVNAYFCVGLFRDGLILDDRKMFSLSPDALEAQKPDVVVTGLSVQGLKAPDQLDFGSIEVGQSRTKPLTIGFYAPPFGHADQSTGMLGQKLFSKNAGLVGTTVTATSPNVIISNPREMGVNASVWQTWAVTFKAHLPLGKQTVELRFQTKDGYCVMVLATAEVVPRTTPEPRTRRKH